MKYEKKMTKFGSSILTGFNDMKDVWNYLQFQKEPVTIGVYDGENFKTTDVMHYPYSVISLIRFSRDLTKNTTRSHPINLDNLNFAVLCQ